MAVDKVTKVHNSFLRRGISPRRRLRCLRGAARLLGREPDLPVGKRRPELVATQRLFLPPQLDQAIRQPGRSQTAVRCVVPDGNRKFYLSTDNGADLTYRSDCPESDILMCSPANPNVIYCGAVNAYRSNDQGATG